MWDAAEIAAAIDAHPDIAADALGAVMLDATGPRLEAAGLTAAAQMFGRAPGDFWVEQLAARSLAESFARALSVRGVAIDFGTAEFEAVDITASNLDPAKAAAFLARAAAFRCRILRDGVVMGSGILVGPTTVLTAFHVLAATPTSVAEPWSKVTVLLSDGRSIDAVMPPVIASPTTADEAASRLPRDDTAVNGDDYAIIRLARPAGALMGSAPLPAQPGAYSRRAAVIVVHYPEGQDKGIGFGSLGKIPRLTSRWGHSVETRGGSSGGGCFDATLTLAGIHQGKGWRDGGRLVPTARFLGKIRPLVDADQAPSRMWSLDGTPDGEFVIGRQAFFEAYALARGNSRVRGIRVKRADAAGDLAGLAFSFAMLDRMTARSPDTRQCRISFETLIPDLANDILRRAGAVGFACTPIEDRQGVAAEQSAPEAVGADRGRRAAAALDATAAALGRQLWLFIDHPAIAFGDAMRAELEGFIDQALKLPHLRLVVAGFEAVAVPGLEFQAMPNPPDIGAPGLMTDYITGFGESDVRLFLADAAAAAGTTLSAERVAELVQQGLAGLADVNGIYDPWQARQVAERLRPAVRAMFAA
ncbi:trypsin-like serine peptidase [Sandarakinorhabdus sp. DWP1-3-1]|uniref:trypsin-like serine peptidase n=1 Tax=Sandarakinorhabdus sp. DWP1-3-1 TaxID=2804627 RepID=UPI003CF8918C